jgi:hypothetical protein
MTRGTLIRTAGTSTLVAVALMLSTLMGAAPVAAEGTREGAWWQLDSRSAPRYFAPNGGVGQVDVIATDLGDAAVKGTSEKPVTLTDTLPAGLEVTHAVGIARSFRDETGFTCTAEPLSDGRTTVSCKFEEALQPDELLEARISVKTVGTPSGRSEAHVEGGEGEGGPAGEVPTGEPPPQSYSAPIEATREPTPFGVERYELRPEDEHGLPDTQAGSHPFQLTSTLDLNQTFEEDLALKTTGPTAPALPRDLHFVLPPGLVGNTNVVAQCSDADFATLVEKNDNLCKSQAAVGVATVTIDEPKIEPQAIEDVPVFNLVPAVGEPARFGFAVDRVPVYLDTEVRTGRDYAVVVTVHDESQAAQLLRSVVSIWGEPADPRHDKSRGWACVAGGSYARKGESCEPPKERATAPFLTLPSSCVGQPQTEVSGDAWPLGQATKGPELSPVSSPMEALQGCEKLPFNPSLKEVQPDQSSASTPTGLKVDVHVPQEAALVPEGLAEADVKDSTVTLPEGMQLSPSAANGLEACSQGGVGFESIEAGTALFSPTVPQPFCPDASKVGTVRIDTPLLPNPLTGSVYLAQQNANPFGSLIALYIVAKDPVSGVLVKLAGEVKLDPNTGRVTSTFSNTPQQPFEDLEIQFFNGPRASQTTPSLCGSYTTTASFTPWAQEGAPATPASSSFSITSGPGGGPCASSPLPFAPGFEAGTNNQAAAKTPFTLTINRPDGQQALGSITMQLPPGLAALISEVTPCPENEALANKCGPGSEVGHTTSSSGLGGEPFTLPGKLYFTGPLKATATHGASPFGLSSVTPAVAGPFNLGNVIVLSTINIDPNTTAATVKSEPIPKMLQGIPVQLEQLHVTVERPGNQPFQFNPTNCNPMPIKGTLTGYEGASVGESYPFQVSNCASLPFKPDFTASTSGHTSKTNGASLDVKITYPPGAYANVAKSVTALPMALPSRLTTIQKACLDTVFEGNPAACGEGSVIGEGIVHTPVFKNELRGPAYLVSHGNRAFPDIEIVLQGEGITLVLDGQTDIKKGITRTTFNAVPDAPVSTFELLLPEGPHSALAANGDLCKPTRTVTERVRVTRRVHGRTVHSFKTVTKTVPEALVIPTTLTAQNGAVLTQNTKIAVTGCGAVKSFKAKSLTRAQKLAKALKACKKKSKKARAACEKQARNKYGAKKKKK